MSVRTFLSELAIICGLVLASPSSGSVANATDSNGGAEALLLKGRSQYLAGEPRMAEETFARVLQIDPANPMALRFLERIRHDLQNRDASREGRAQSMVKAVDRAWETDDVRIGPFINTQLVRGELQERLEGTRIPEVLFDHLELRRAVAALAELSRSKSDSGGPEGGVNFSLIDPEGLNPPVTVSLHDLSLARVVDIVVESVGFAAVNRGDVIEIRPATGVGALDTRIFPVAHDLIARLSGKSADPKTRSTPPSLDSDAIALRGFLQLAGVNFEGTPGSALAFDGSAAIVTQTVRNLARIGAILKRYQEARQVEIEARFMEVQDGALDEIGVNWAVGKRIDSQSGLTVSNYNTSNRSLSEAFSSQGSFDNLTINAAATAGDPDNGVAAAPGLNLSIPMAPPGIPGGVFLGAPNAALATLSGILGQFNVNAVVRALSQKSGTQLLSSPKVTVLSGSQATITVAQELRYPQAYGQVQSQVGSGGVNSGGSAGVTITAGTPQDFTTRDVGVELRVTPIVEADGRSISLDLNPKVTEFEGFVEYGGSSVAISSGTTVTVPSGFYQPIFAVRDISTRVTLEDGATLVMGGLTREDVKNSHDKVPVLGNVPVLGRLFRSDGSSAQKRNLLIFVTASLVPAHAAAGAPAGAESPLYRHPVTITPAAQASKP
ncbi:MAG TPA: hypothetical protein VHD32_11020 [Candidatus Didemnitutus sp.]|nr:hypothetical protein [Candidatus Didemnitutus sp.]